MNYSQQNLKLSLTPSLQNRLPELLKAFSSYRGYRDGFPFYKDGKLHISPHNLRILIEGLDSSTFGELDIRRLQKEGLRQIKHWIESEEDEDVKLYAYHCQIDLERVQPGLLVDCPPYAHIPADDLDFVL